MGLFKKKKEEVKEEQEVVIEATKEEKEEESKRKGLGIFKKKDKENQDNESTSDEEKRGSKLFDIINNGPSIKEDEITAYEQKYVKAENNKSIKFFLTLAIILVGAILFACEFFVFEKIYNMNVYAGYVAIGVGVILFIIFYVVPVCKITKSEYFITNVNRTHMKEAKIHNRKARIRIAEKMIEFNEDVNGAGWYDNEKIMTLQKALYHKDDKLLKQTLGEMYSDKGCIKKTAKKMIAASSAKCGVLTAISQDEKLDSVIVIITNLKLIKDIIFLYGFRPSDAKMAKIYRSVIRNTLVAYGVSSAGIGKILGKSAAAALANVTNPIASFVGNLIVTVVDSSIQGAVNAALTYGLGKQTIKYLKYEYNLQSILDDINLEITDEEEASTLKEIQEGLKEMKKDKKQLKDM